MTLRFAKARTPDGDRRVLMEDGGYRVLDIAAGDPIWGDAAIVRTDELLSPDRVQLLLPVNGRSVYGMARNSGPDARELPPLVFQKPISSLTPAGADIVLPPAEAGVIFGEAEIAIIVGSTLQHASAEQCSEGIAGWTIANDVTGRDLQREDPLWFAAKGYDTFTPLGAVVQLGPPEIDVRMRLLIDGSVATSAALGELARSVGECLAHLSSITSLRRGDVVLTGAPGGGADLVPGQTVTVDASGLPPVVSRIRRATSG